MDLLTVSFAINTKYIKNIWISDCATKVVLHHYVFTTENSTTHNLQEILIKDPNVSIETLQGNVHQININSKTNTLSIDIFYK